MNRTVMAIIGATAGEVLAMATLGKAIEPIIRPDSSLAKKIIITSGAMVLGWTLGTTVHKELCKTFDNLFDTNSCEVMSYE